MPNATDQCSNTPQGATVDTNGCTIANERDVLMALYNATGGTNWKNNTNWNTTAPISTWYGVTVVENHVTEIDLDNNNLIGTIPSEIVNLSYLKVLYLHSNSGISGGIPLEIGKLTNLEELAFVWNNNMTGTIPPSIVKLTKLKGLYLAVNNFSGIIPDLTRLPLDTFWIYANQFEFGDFENEFASYKANISDFRYPSMDRTGSVITYDLVVGANYTMTMDPVSGTNVTYQWYKNDVTIDGATSLTYTINNIQISDAADYTCKASSPIVTGLTIDRNIIHIYGPISVSDKNALIALYNATDGDHWSDNYGWKSSSPVHEWFGLEVLGNRVNALNLDNNNLVGVVPTEIGNLTSNKLSGAIPTEIGNLTAMLALSLNDNQITSLDVSKNTALLYLFCFNNQLSYLNIKNGNNANIRNFDATNNPNLTCIDVDNPTDANSGTGNYANWTKDVTANYSTSCQSSLGIDDEILDKSVKMYPNPVTDMLSISSGSIPITRVEIYSVLGKMIKTINKNFNAIQTEDLSSGLYIIRIYSENGTLFKKLIKQ